MTEKSIYYIVPPDDRVVRLRVRPAPADFPGGGSLITFESESDISDLQSSLRNLATKILTKREEDEPGCIVEEDKGIKFRGVNVMTYYRRVLSNHVIHADNKNT